MIPTIFPLKVVQNGNVANFAYFYRKTRLKDVGIIMVKLESGVSVCSILGIFSHN